MCRIRITHIDDHIDILQNILIFQDILKAYKFHIKRGSGKCFDNTCIGIILLEVNGMMHHMAAPGSHLAPAVKYSNLFYTIGRGSLNIFI